MSETNCTNSFEDLKAVGFKADNICVVCQRIASDHPSKEQVKGNLKITLLSDHGTVLSTHLLLGRTIPTTDADFWSLVTGVDEVDGNLFKNGKATVLTKDGLTGEGQWVKLTHLRIDESSFCINQIDDCYQYQVQRFSTPYSSLTQPPEMPNTHTNDNSGLVKHVRGLFSANPFADAIPELHVDSTILNLCAWLENKAEDNADAVAIATLFAMPGSGKTKSVLEAAKRAKSKHKRIRICDVKYEDVQRCDEYVKSLTKNFATDTDTPSCFSFHFDEVQSLLAKPGGELVLKDLAATCTAFANRDKRLKFVFTGTNINARKPINLGSECKTKPFFMDGSFPMDFTTSLYEEHLEQKAGEDMEGLLERCRHNRRVTSVFLEKLWNDKHKRNGSDQEKPASEHYEDALDAVSISITSQLGEDNVHPAACRIFRVLLQAINDEERPLSANEGEGESKVIAITVDTKLFASDLQYVSGGGLNVCREVRRGEVRRGEGRAGKRKVHVFLPEGCVFEILMKIMGRAVQLSTYNNLLSFLRTSRVKTFNLGWFMEALVVYDLQCASSEFEQLLNCGQRHGKIMGAKVVYKPKLWECIPEPDSDELIWLDRDEMNSHQNRWIDIGYRQDDGKIVIIECKSGVTNKSGAGRKFFNEAIALAKKHTTIQWIAVYLCSSQPDQDEKPAEKDLEKVDNLEVKILVLPEDSDMAKNLREGRSEPEDQELMDERLGSGGIQNDFDYVYAGGTQGSPGTPISGGKRRKTDPTRS